MDELRGIQSQAHSLGRVSWAVVQHYRAVSVPWSVFRYGHLCLADRITEHGHSSHHSAKSSKTPSIHTVTYESTAPAASPVTISQSRSLALHTERSGSYSSLYGHPAATRASFVQTANHIAQSSTPTPADRTHKHRSRPSLDLWSPDSSTSSNPPFERDTMSIERTIAPHEQTNLLQGPPVSYTDHAAPTPAVWSSDESQGHHSHGGSMNMKALLLHVLGDALGNVGVIATGLIIWLTSWSLKYYCDPVISLVITAIIFHSALPLGESLMHITNRNLVTSLFSPQYILYTPSSCPLGSLVGGRQDRDTYCRRRALRARVAYMATLGNQDHCLRSCHSLSQS